jgi:hypothetical protein
MNVAKACSTGDDCADSSRTLAGAVYALCSVVLIVGPWLQFPTPVPYAVYVQYEAPDERCTGGAASVSLHTGAWLLAVFVSLALVRLGDIRVV